MAVRGIKRPNSYPQVLDLNDVVVLITRDDRDDGRPVASHVVDRERHLAGVDVDVRLRLQPPSQSAAGSVGNAVDKVPEEQPLVLVAAERDDAVECLETKSIIFYKSYNLSKLTHAVVKQVMPVTSECTMMTGDT